MFINYFADFLFPYVQFLFGAAYTLQQILEGVGVSGSNFVVVDENGNFLESFWSPGEAAIAPFSILFVYSSLLFIFLLMAGYVLARKKGALIVLAVFLIPGILNVVGLWPNTDLRNDVYTIGGGGNLGGNLGLIPLLIIGLLTGWCFVLISTDAFSLKGKFRNAYDHFWYASAVLTGVFFVSDSGVNYTRSEVVELERNARGSTAYLLHQVRRYERYCHVENISNKDSCRWASQVQQSLNHLLAQDGKGFALFGPKSTNELYLPFSQNMDHENIIQIRRELKEYNNRLCPSREIGEGIIQHSRVSGVCQMVPPGYCQSFPEEFEGVVEKDALTKTSAISSECIIPTLVQFRGRLERLSSKLDKAELKKYFRWIFYVLFTIVVGGKIANATTQLFMVDRREAEEGDRSRHLILKPIEFFRRLIVVIIKGVQILLARLVVGKTTPALDMSGNTYRFTQRKMPEETEVV